MAAPEVGISSESVSSDLLIDAKFRTVYGIDESEEFPNRIDILESKAPVTAIPGRMEFMGKIRDALTRDINHEACLYPDAWDVVDTMMRKGPTAVWTQGDVWGYGTQDTPGSYEQIKKVALSPIPAMRREVHRLRLGRLAAGCDEPPSGLNDILTLVAGEDKFSGEALEQLTFYFKSQGVSQLVILEDRLSNLVRLRTMLEADRDDHISSFKTLGMWVRQGKYGQAEPNHDLSGIIAIPSLEHAPPIIRALPDNVGFISDYDGVLSNQPRRLELQAAAVRYVLARNNWI
jgi:hypothetical protein